jgi:hypothetical protein
VTHLTFMSLSSGDVVRRREGEDGQVLDRNDAQSQFELASARFSLSSRASSFGIGVGIGDLGSTLSGLDATKNEEALELIGQISSAYEALRDSLATAQTSGEAAAAQVAALADHSEGLATDDSMRSRGGSQSESGATSASGASALERAKKPSATDARRLDVLREELAAQVAAREAAEKAAEEARKELEAEKAARVAAEKKLEELTAPRASDGGIDRASA